MAVATSLLQAAALMAAGLVRVPTQEEYVGLTPVVSILPWFLAGSLFPISALPAGLAGIARGLPTTHALALLRYGVVDRHGVGLHDI